MQNFIQEVLQAKPHSDVFRFMSGVEAGIQSVGKDGVVHLVPILQEFQEDPEFQLGFLKGLCMELLRVAAASAVTPRFVADGVESEGKRRVAIGDLIPVRLRAEEVAPPRHVIKRTHLEQEEGDFPFGWAPPRKKVRVDLVLSAAWCSPALPAGI